MMNGNNLCKRLTLILLMLMLSVTPALAAAPAPATAAEAQPAQAVATVPLRAYAEAAGADVDWEAETMTVQVSTFGNVTFRVRIGEAEATVNGKAVPLGGKAELVNSKTMVPLVFLKSVIPVPVTWDPATATATVDSQALTGLKFAEGLVNGTAATMAGQFSPGFRAAMPDARLAAVAKALEAAGSLQGMKLVAHTKNAVHENIIVMGGFQAGPAQFTIRLTPDGQIDDYVVGNPDGLVPVAGAPAYAKPDSFTELQVVVGEAPYRLPATLTLPKGGGPFPAVVLVHGSGSSDRDESYLALKPFRDLAYGLASKGIAVLRYEKRSFEHSMKFTVDPQLGLKTETIDDAVMAVELLRQTAGIDPQRVLVLGHSQGGYAMPRILEAAQGKAAGGILMAGPNSFIDVVVEQHRLLAQMGMMPAPAAEAAIKQAEVLTDPAFDPAAPPAGGLLGMPYWYWAPFRDDAATLAKTQTAPLLILQGGRDYQVQAAQLKSWQEALADRTNVTYKLYDKLNHMFTEGEGPLSSPMEYTVAANIPEYVINDISAWVLAQ